MCLRLFLERLAKPPKFQRENSMTKRNYFQFSFFALMIIGVFWFSYGSAQAGLVDCGNATTGSSASGCTFSDLFETALKLIEYLLSAAAVIAVGGVVYGGVLMVTSAGNEGRSTAGKKAVTNSLIGLAVILMAFLIVRTLFTVLGFNKTDELLNNPGQFIQPQNNGSLITPGQSGNNVKPDCGILDGNYSDCDWPWN